MNILKLEFLVQRVAANHNLHQSNIISLVSRLSIPNSEYESQITIHDECIQISHQKKENELTNMNILILDFPGDLCYLEVSKMLINKATDRFANFIHDLRCNGHKQL